MSDRQRSIIKVFRKFSNSLGPDVLAFLEGVIEQHDIADEDVETSIELIAKEYNKEDDATMKVSLDVLQRVYENLQDRGEDTRVEHEIIDPDNHLFIIDAYEMPRWVWSQERGTFERITTPLTSAGTPESRITSIRDRLHIIKQCVLRNEHFAPSTLPSQDRERLVTLRSTKQLLGRAGQRFLLLGLLAHNKEGKVCLEDADGRVELDFSRLDEPGEGFFTDGSFVLVEGEYTEEGTLELIAIGQPPCEPRETARSIYGHIDFLGKGATSLLEDRQYAARVQQELTDMHFFFFSDVWLDHPQTLPGLQKILDNCVENDFVPKLIVLCGNFTSKSIAHGNARDIQRYQDNFDALGDLIASYHTVARNTYIVFVPGPLDITINSILPRRPLLSSFVNKLKSRVSRAHFASNPCRIKFFNQEIVIFREDLMAKMLRNVIGVKRDVRSEDLKRYLVQSILDQGHLSPLSLHIQPTLSDYDHALRLYPLPTVLVLADKYDRFKVTYTGCHVFNPGSFVGKNLSWSAYKPSEANSEECQAYDYYRAALLTTQVLAFGHPQYPWSTSLLLWLIRLLTFAVLFRTYLGPWILQLTSSRIRVKSVSLRSVRGIFFRTGGRTIRVDRIAFLWNGSHGSKRLTLKVEGFSIEIANADASDSKKAPRKPFFGNKLSFLSLRPVLKVVRTVYTATIDAFDPFLRPVLRKYAVACLQLVIRWLPTITQAIALEVHQASVTFAALPGTKIVVDEMYLTTSVELQETGQEETAPEATQNGEGGQGMAGWSSRVKDGFRKSLDRAWGSTTGKGKVVFKAHSVEGTMPQRVKGEAITTTFLSVPDITELTASMDFSPRAGTIEPHTLDVSLSLGRLIFKVDLLATVIDKLKPPPRSTISERRNAPVPPLELASPRSSIFFGSPGLSSLQSALPSFTNSMFSGRGRSGSLSAFSERAGNLLSPKSLKSPTSPFFKAISASMIKPRRQHLIRRSTRLRDELNISPLSVLRSFKIKTGPVRLSASSESPLREYSATIRGINVLSGLADPSNNPLARKWLGTQMPTEKYDPDTYSLTVHMGQIKAERESSHGLFPLLAIAPSDLRVVAHQWPAPLLLTSPLMRGDPNAPFVGIAIDIPSIEATQQLRELGDLINALPQKDRSTPDTAAPAPTSRPLALPRIVFQVNCGTISARLLFTTTTGHELRAIVAKTNGFAINLQSEYRHASSPTRKKYPTYTSVLPVELACMLSVDIEPTAVRTCCIKDGLPGGSEVEDPCVFSAGAIQLTGALRAVAESDGPGEGVAIIDKSTLLADSHLHLDSVCLEFWHPTVVDSVHQLLALVPPRPPTTSNPSPEAPTSSGFKKPPIGILFSISLTQCVAFVTAPDINPNDEYELSRGLSFRTGAGLEVCSIHANHNHWFDDLPAMDARSKLLLPLQSVLQNAVAAGKSNPQSRCGSAFAKLQFQHSVIRSLVATQYEPSEPVFADRMDVPQTQQDFLRVNHIQVELCASSGTGDEASGGPLALNVTAQIPTVRVDFKLSHVYSVLLAIQTLASLQARRSGPEPPPKQRSPVRIQLQATVANIQAYLTLPKRNVVVRVDALSAKMASGGLPRVGFGQAIVLVPLPSRVNRWETEKPGRWDELLNLQKWEATLTLEKPHQSVAVSGESGYLHIPSGFVFHDLILDASVLAKALKHITHITKAGQFSEFPLPEAEGPKAVPHLSFRLRYFCIDFQDDPFECNLAQIWLAAEDATKQRMEREDAFAAKVAAIATGQQQTARAPGDREFVFDAKHTIPIEEARKRLNEVHTIDWKVRLDVLNDVRAKAEDANQYKLFGSHRPPFEEIEPNLVPVIKRPRGHPPLLRIGLDNFNLLIGGPSFPVEELPSFLYTQGSGLPRDTQFSLLVPLHIHFTLSALRVTLRDYPLPILNILPHENGSDKTAFTFDTDLVVAEEMGTEASIEWYNCPIIDAANSLDNESPWSISVPKTLMPVKTYASPSISVNSPFPTVLGWGVSYGPAMQDVMRVVDTLSSPPQDPSPSIGFWDKLRLILHWKIHWAFTGDVHVYLKGSRNPHEPSGPGAGFVLAFQGSPRIHIGYENDQRELVQIESDMMAMAIPDMDHVQPMNILPQAQRTFGIPRPFKKVLARLNSGVKFGVGFLPEQACGPDCRHCTGPPSERQCRIFTFKPHYEVTLEKKPFKPKAHTIDDSFNEFRSDFVHTSLSLRSGTKKVAGKQESERGYSSLHLTPQLFTHFWSWCQLFDGALSLPIRQGNYYPARPITPKLGRHMATIKYRISIPHLYVMHGYIDDSRETWVDGITSWVGVKGMVDELHVDMHQREEEALVPGPVPGTTRVARRKPFSAVQVVLKGLDMRALVAVFDDPLKKEIPMAASQQRSNYRKHSDLPPIPPSSQWHDMNDFIELDWTPSADPQLHLMPVVTCPRFSYSKRASSQGQNQSRAPKFGSEDSHVCLLDKEPSAPRIQILLASARAAELRGLIRKASHHTHGRGAFDQQMAEKMVSLLEDYVTLLQDVDAKVDTKPSDLHSYFLPSEIISPKEWEEFENVYHIHCPSIFLDAAVRDVMMQYYYCSRARRGLEYHMATRAVKFIRDQAQAATTEESSAHGAKTPGEALNIATTALRKILGGEKASMEVSRDPKRQDIMSDPLEGWGEGVELRKSHCCLLLKPQIILRGTGSNDTCIVAASQAKLQSYAIMDIHNSDDPVSGKIMSRNYTSLSGMQVYAPTSPSALVGNSSIPLEVLIDLRCETKQFERLVPQTDASFHYDKFNRLRLRNKATETLTQSAADESPTNGTNHLQDQTDLIRVHIPRFTVSANSEHFEAISNVVTKLLLFSDAAHKMRLDRLETMIFAYDFRDLLSAANVISNLQSQLRDAVAKQEFNPIVRLLRPGDNDAERLSLLRIKAHIYLLQEELGLLFDAIKLAQDRFDAAAEQNNALLLHASSSEISWRMLDDRRNLLAKLVVQDINFHWLNRQDSSTVNHVTVGNLTAFDGSRYAMWAEIISKYDEPANHPLLKKGLFCLAKWTILAPVGGITIYENFELSFHPLRLQIDAKVGRRIMQYLFPDRKARQVQEASQPAKTPIRASVDSPRTAHPSEGLSLPAPRRLATSRSFSDLRGAREHSLLTAPAFLTKNRSTDSLNNLSTPNSTTQSEQEVRDSSEAAVMKNRSNQKSFVFVRISSLNLLLSVSKEGSFECRDARIKTKDLEYRNQTWSFEELVNQFIPSNMGWRGWVKMAFHQPLLPVLPVAKELLAKTKWTASKSGSQPHDSPLRMLHPRMMLTADDDTRLELMKEVPKVTTSSSRPWKSPFQQSKNEIVTAAPKPMTPSQPDPPRANESNGSAKRPESRNRVKSLFSRRRSSSKPRQGSED